MATRMNSTTQKPMRIFQMFKQATKVPSMNWTFSSSIVVILLIPYTIYFLVSQLITQPIILQLTNNILQLIINPQIDPEVRQLLLQVILADVKSLILLGLIPVFINLFVSLLIVTAISGAAVAFYHGENFGFTRWLAKIKSSWKGILVTILYIKLLGLGYVVALYTLLIILLFVFGSFILAGVVLLLGLLLSIRLSLTWSMGFVAAATEDRVEDCGGLVALGLGAKVIKERRRQGYALYLVILVFTFVLGVAYGVVSGVGQQPNSSNSKVVMLVVVVVAGDLLALWSFFAWAVFSIYYADCKGAVNDMDSGYRMIQQEEV